MWISYAYDLRHISDIYVYAYNVLPNRIEKSDMNENVVELIFVSSPSHSTFFLKSREICCGHNS